MHHGAAHTHVSYIYTYIILCIYACIYMCTSVLHMCAISCHEQLFKNGNHAAMRLSPIIICIN